MPVSRRDFLAAAGVSGLALVLGACGDDDSRGSLVTHTKEPIHSLVFSSTPGSIDREVLRDFERRTGGAVKYSEEIRDDLAFEAGLRSKLAARTGIARDLVVVRDPIAARWIRNRWVEPLDKRNIPNAEHLRADARVAAFDDWSLPGLADPVGIAYKGEAPRSVGGLLARGRVAVTADPYDATGLVMLGMGVDPSRAGREEVMAAIDKLEKARRDGRISGFGDPSGAAAAITTASAARRAGMDFALPSEGGLLGARNMLIPKRADSPYAAEAFMDFVYDAPVAARVAAKTGLLSPVAGVRQSFPRAKLHRYPTLSAADERAMRDRWAEVMGV
jgi:spermidine/putrescine transport system substrate-binding protein